jgi:DNA-binding MarR family transcriptional regulator
MIRRSRVGAETAREYLVYPTSKSIKIHAALKNTGESLYQRMIQNVGESELKHLVAQMRETLKQLD